MKIFEIREHALKLEKENDQLRSINNILTYLQ